MQTDYQEISEVAEKEGRTLAGLVRIMTAFYRKAKKV